MAFDFNKAQQVRVQLAEGRYELLVAFPDASQLVEPEVSSAQAAHLLWTEVVMRLRQLADGMEQSRSAPEEG